MKTKLRKLNWLRSNSASKTLSLMEHASKNGSIETGKIDFCIKGEIPRFELLGRAYRKPDFSEPITRKEYDRLSKSAF